MLYFITFDPKYETEELIESIYSLGDIRRLYDGCYLAAICLTALGIRQRLLPTLTRGGRYTNLMIVRLFTHHCAGSIAEHHKQFLKQHITPDPVPRVKPEPYSF